MTDPARTFGATRVVRLGDVVGSGRIGLDALARYLQDVATDDAADVGLADGWVLRRLAMRLDALPRFRQVVDLVTWCSGTSGSAAERRTRLSVDGVVSVDAVALWVFVGSDGRPARLDRERFAAYGPAATGRRVPTRLRHAPPPAGVGSRPWPLRAADVDVLRHVNNSVSLASVEDLLEARDPAAQRPPRWVEVEYHAALDPGDEPTLAWSTSSPDTLDAWLLVAGLVRTSVRLGFTECATPPT